MGMVFPIGPQCPRMGNGRAGIFLQDYQDCRINKILKRGGLVSFVLHYFMI